MTSSVPVATFGTSELEPLATDDWRARVLASVADGAHVLTVYGRALDAATAALTAILRSEGQLHALRTHVSREDGYRALTADLPAMHCFEREIHETCGVAIHDHPWLKPIRFAGRDQAAMASYPFYRVDGKEVHEVAVGPIHAGVIEPGSFRFACYGERVLHLEIHHGYQHRGVERLLLAKPPWRLGPWIETAAGDASVAHAWAFSAGLEALAGIGEDANATSRAAMLELERIGMHLASLSGLATDIAFLPAASTYARLRTTAINTSMRVCGSRFGRGAVRPGGSGCALDEALAVRIRNDLAAMRRDLDIVDDCFRSARSVRHRLVGTGTLAADLAAAIGVVGVVAKASGIAADVRAPRRGAYAEPEIGLPVASGGDCWARSNVRIDEIGASLAWLERVLADPARATWRARRGEPAALAPSRLAVAAVESWRGEVVHAIETDAGGSIAHYKVQDPSLRNWFGLALAVRGNGISDFPICNKSFDLSYAGNDL